MICRCIVLLVLPTLMLAKIFVTLDGVITQDDWKNLTIEFTGNESDVISDTERNTFNLSDFNLKRAAKSLIGIRPHETYLGNLVVFRELYMSEGWKPVHRILIPERGEIIKVSCERGAIIEKFFENNSSEPIIFNFAVSQEKQNTLSSSWSTEGELSSRDNITYDINIKFVDGKETSFHYNSSWGENTEHSRRTRVDDPRPMEIHLNRGESTVAQLRATKCSIKFEVVYKATLTGETGMYYPDKNPIYEHLEVNTCLRTCGLSTQKMSREVIDIEFYADSSYHTNSTYRQRKGEIAKAPKRYIEKLGGAISQFFESSKSKILPINL